MSRSRAVAAAAVIVLAGLAGCGPSDSTAAQPTGGASTGGASGAGSTVTSAPPAKATLPTNGKCVLITADQAAALISSTPKSSAGGVGSEGIVHIDGCTYTGATSNLGYDVNNMTGAGVSPKTVVTQAKAALGQAPDAVLFDVPGGDDAVGFTMPVGAKTMARLEIAKGSYSIGVNAVSPDPATAKHIALSAAAILVAAIP